MAPVRNNFGPKPKVTAEGEPLELLEARHVLSDHIVEEHFDAGYRPLTVVEQRTVGIRLRVSQLMPLRYEHRLPKDPFVIWEESDREMLEFFGLTERVPVYLNLGDTLRVDVAGATDFYRVTNIEAEWPIGNSPGAVIIEGKLIYADENSQPKVNWNFPCRAPARLDDDILKGD